MVMSWIFSTLVGFSCVCAFVTGSFPALSGAVAQGAQAGITLAISLAGSLCLWTGVGELMTHAGLTNFLARVLAPVLNRLFPSCSSDPQLAQALSGNVCANLLGLGNAATPMGLRAVARLKGDSRTASDEMCRLIVLNTASIQLIPTNVAAIRSALGCDTPFDLLPAVWVTSVCAAGVGLGGACFLGKVWK